MLGSKRKTSSKPSFVDATGLLLESHRKRGGRFVASSAAAFLSTAAAAAKAARFLAPPALFFNVDAFATNTWSQEGQAFFEIGTSSSQSGHGLLGAGRFLLPMASPGPRP
jgi:hypothetical protein